MSYILVMTKITNNLRVIINYLWDKKMFQGGILKLFVSFFFKYNIKQILKIYLAECNISEF